MAGSGVEADGGAAGGADPSGPPGGHAVRFFGDEVWRCSCGLAWDDQSGGWGATIINHLYLHPVRALPPPHRGDRSFDDNAGFYWVHVPRHPAGWPWVQEPKWPEPYRRRAEVQEVSHRVWQDYGTDGARRWTRWWCSCGAYGQGWPTNHGEKS